MAFVKCKSCGNEMEVGFMPAGTSGLAVIIPLAVAGLLAVFLIPHIGWYSLLVALAGFLASFYLPGTIEFLMASRKKCPKCKAAKWSFPYTKGFGL